MERVVAERAVVEEDGVGWGVVEARDEGDEGGLAGAGGADDGEGGAGGDVEGDVVEDFGAGGVGEAQVVEGDVAGDLWWSDPGLRSETWGTRCCGVVEERGVGFGVGDGGLLGHQVVDAGDRGGAALDEVDDPADGDHGPGELDHEDVVGEELIDGDVVLDDFVAADEEGDDERDAEDELERGPEHGHEAGEEQAAADVLLVGGFEGGDLGVFLGEGADEAGGGEVLFGLRGDVGEHGLDALEAGVDAGAEVLDEDRGEGQREEGEHRQARS